MSDKAEDEAAAQERARRFAVRIYNQTTGDMLFKSISASVPPAWRPPPGGVTSFVVASDLGMQLLIEVISK